MRNALVGNGRILRHAGVSDTREATTEKRNAADFLFPGEDEYADRRYPDDQLAMLAVKTSCKDRWRQVLAEADRIRAKHLLTLEPAISRIQTAEMQGQGLQLVLSASLHSTYQKDQHTWLLGVGDFLGAVRDLRGRWRLLIYGGGALTSHPSCQTAPQCGLAEPDIRCARWTDASPKVGIADGAVIRVSYDNVYSWAAS
ncbi:MAG: type II restriction endonuclease [Pseudomonadota bacterium]